MTTRENPVRPYYGFRVNKFITAVLTLTGVLSISVTILFYMMMFSTWVLVLFGVLGTIMLAIGALWHLMIGFASNTKKIKVFTNNYLEHVEAVWDGEGEVLDIGTGLGRTAIEIAKRFPGTQVIGMDTWTKKWEFWGMTKTGAERNARIEGVSNRCTFQQGNALNMPFKEGEFQLVVSTFVFHEIPVPDRTVILKEVARVLAPGGVFLVCDTFPRGYNVKNSPQLIEKVERLGLEDVRCTPLEEAGLDLGALLRIWGAAYLTGIKVN